MGQALYRKYRSRSLSEVIGQDHITKTLKEALKTSKISHAYLFSGPRGVGKTSVARIMAHEVNKLPYSDESLHLDIIEIDAASNRRIDEIRELRQKVHTAPTSATYKVYIIDEVHMLTREAFNALLKTLEEPPAHAIFILATTEAHKLPETIISRTQRFTFKPVDKQQVAEQLKFIASREKINIDQPALELLAEHGEGSLRDSIGMLDQLAASGKLINEATVRNLLGLPPKNLIVGLLKHLVDGQPKQAIGALEELQEQGANPPLIATQLSKLVRRQLLEGNTHSWSIKLLKQLAVIPLSAQAQEELEIAILEASAPISDALKPTPSSEGASKPRALETKLEPKQKTTTPRTPKISPLVIEDIQVTKTKDSSFSLEDWPAVLESVKEQPGSLYGALRLTEPSLSEDVLTLTFSFPFHQKKVMQAKNIQQLEQQILKISGVRLKVEGVVNKKAAVIKDSGAPKPELELDGSTTPSESYRAISNIFPAAEMLES